MYSKLERPIWRKRSLYSALLSIRLQAGFPMLVSTPPRRKPHPEVVTYGASSRKGQYCRGAAVNISPVVIVLRCAKSPGHLTFGDWASDAALVIAETSVDLARVRDAKAALLEPLFSAPQSGIVTRDLLRLIPMRCIGLSSCKNSIVTNAEPCPTRESIARPCALAAVDATVSLLDALGIGCRQPVLFDEGPVCPHCSVIAGAKIIKFGDQSIA